ncbi:MFS transporter [Antrihabitans sp. YC2-6]|uniref:MFS transporter n=1 Tax=Antrihabitans sp. YC2-6 TaxID=2799498 RepID=UPI0018F6A1D9|nr:MFS transporter [Antrihabitans sp. YC2-6]MBJ8343833.1 MFS transporter [Antrihabitans sp. YC2-6]
MTAEPEGTAVSPGTSAQPFRRLPYVRSLIITELFSAAGSTMAVLAVAYLSFNDSKSVIHTVLVSAAFSLPTALLGTFAGRVAARSGHRRMLFFCTVIKLALYVAMAALAFVDALSIPLLLATSVLLGAVAAFDYPAWMQFERDIVPANQLDQANGTLSAYASASTFAGGILGGVLLGITGPWALLLLNAFSYGAFLVILAKTRPTERDTRPGERVGFWDVVRYVRGQPAIAIAFIQTGLLGLFVAPIAQLLPAIAHGLSGGTNLGIVTGAVAVGAIGLAAVVGRLRKRFSRATILYGTFLVAGLIMFFLGLFGDVLEGAPLWFLVLLALIPFGLLFSLAQAVLTAIVQTRVDPEMEGPVFALYAIIYTLCAPLGGIFLGRFADQHDVWGSLKVAGVMVTIASVAIFVVRVRRTQAEPAAIEAQTTRSGQFDGILRGHLLHLHHDRDCGHLDAGRGKG